MVMCVETISGTPFDMFPYNPNSYSEAQWMPNTMASVPGFEYDGGASYSQSTSQQQAQSSQPPSHSTPASRRAPGIEVSSVPPHMLESDRPKSSPGNYTDNPGDVSPYQQPHPHPHPHHQHHHHHPHQQQQTSHDDPSRYNMASYSYPSSTLPLSPPTSTTAYLAQDMGQNMSNNPGAMSRSSPVPIAPNPSDLRGNNKRKRENSTPDRPPELTDEEKLLLKLKEDENLPWKDIAMRFQQDIGKTYQVPALQMRFKRLRERIRVWTENDIQALEQAYEHWEKHQFEIIANKMCDFGCPERFPTKAVQRKWEELHADRLAAQQQQHQPFPFGPAGANSAAAFAAAAAYPGSHGILPSQHGIVRHLSVGPGGAPAFSPFTSPRAPAAGQFIFGQPAGAQPLLSPSAAPGGVPSSAAAGIYGASPLVPSNTKFSALPGPSGNHPARSASIPTPRSAGTSPGPFAAPDDAVAAAAAAAAAATGTTSITEIGGVNMGLGLGLSMSPSMASDTLRTASAGRQRSFSSMH